MHQARPEQGRNHDLDERAGDGDPADSDQILDREMQPDTEHQQDHADLRELVRQRSIADEAGSEGADRHACEQIADERRQLQPARSEEHTSELQSLMRNSYAVFCLHKKKPTTQLYTHSITYTTKTTG